MRAFSFLFLPEFARAFGEVRMTARRLALLTAAMLPAARARDFSWRRLVDRRHAPRLALAALLFASGAASVILALASEASAQQTTIDAGLFDEEDDETRAILGFLNDLPDDTGSVVLADMLFLFNGGLLVLAAVLLVWQVAAGAVDTARAGRWGFGGWQIVRVVAAVALMAPLAGGLNGAQMIVLGLTNLGGDFATAVWSPFTTDILTPTRSVAPGRGTATLRTIIGRALVLEVCLATANTAAGATLVARESVAEAIPPPDHHALRGDDVGRAARGVRRHRLRRSRHDDRRRLLHLALGGGDRPAAGRLRARPGRRRPRRRGPLPRRQHRARSGHPQHRRGGRRAFRAGKPVLRRSAPDADATLGGSGLEAAYARIIGDALAASQRDHDQAMRDLARRYARNRAGSGPPRSSTPLPGRTAASRPPPRRRRRSGCRRNPSPSGRRRRPPP